MVKCSDSRDPDFDEIHRTIDEIHRTIKSGPVKISIAHYGLFAEHNMPCPVYIEEHAMFCCNHGIFHPSQKAQEEGYRLVKIKRGWLFNLLAPLIFKDFDIYD